jgi:dTDP-4-amino-4,6-dideoxygalactose transaminase
MTTGEGGMVTTDDDVLAERLRLLRSHGMTSLTWDRHRGHAFSYDVVAPGYNYRIDEMRAAIGRAQLAKLAANNRRRARLDEAIARCCRLPRRAWGCPTPRRAARRLSPAAGAAAGEGTNRVRFMAEMKARGIQTSIHYPPVHHFSYYRRDDGRRCPLTD